jgi:uncharacterized FlaG/YvyC family protein
MAETGFNTRSVPVAGVAENRDFNIDRPRDGVRRVEPLEKTDPPAETSQGQEQRTEEIARMVESALSNSRLKILQDEDEGGYIYLMVDQDTGETVRRWPPEKHADLVEYLRTRQAGLVDRTV